MSTRDVTLRWSDPNNIEKGYKVYRSKSPMDISNMPEPIATLEKNTTEFIDEAQTIGDTNYYRVSAWIDGSEVYSEEVEIVVETIVEYFIGFNSGVRKYRNDIITKEYNDSMASSAYVHKHDDKVVIEKRFDSKVTLLDDNLNLIWEREHGYWIHGLSVNSDYIVYRTSNSSSDGNFRLDCLDYSNNKIWTRYIGQINYSICDSDSVYVSGPADSLTKLNLHDGTTTWKIPNIQERLPIPASLDVTDGNLYIMGGINNPKLKKINSIDGELIFEKNLEVYTSYGQSDINGDLLYINNDTLYKIDGNSGSLVWQYNSDLSMKNLCIFYEEGLVVCSARDVGNNNHIVWININDGNLENQYPIDVYPTSICSSKKSELEVFMSLV